MRAGAGGEPADLGADRLAEQERTFAQAFAAGDIGLARPLYRADVVYLSPTVRLFDRPARIEGVDATLEFIQLTIRDCERIDYRAVESAVLPDGRSAFARIHFDWGPTGARLRSNYVVIYRYREGRIRQQELYYDPSARPESLA